MNWPARMNQFEKRMTLLGRRARYKTIVYGLIVLKGSKFVFTMLQVFARDFDSSSKLVRTFQRRKMGELAAFIEETDNGEELIILGFSLLFMGFKFWMQFGDHFDSEFCCFGMFIIESATLTPGCIEAWDGFSNPSAE